MRRAPDALRHGCANGAGAQRDPRGGNDRDAGGPVLHLAVALGPKKPVGLRLLGVEKRSSSFLSLVSPRKQKAPRKAKLLDKLQPSKVAFVPSRLKHDNAPKGFQRKGCGFLMAGNGNAASVKVMKPAVAAGRSDVNEPIGFERTDEFAGGNALRQFQTLTKTAEDSVDVMRASGGISFPSSESSSTIM